MDAINFDALPPVTKAKIRLLRKRHYYCQSCEEVVPADKVKHNINPVGESCHYVMDSSGWYPCGPVVPAPVYVRLNRRGYSVGVDDAPGWALVVGPMSTPAHPWPGWALVVG